MPEHFHHPKKETLCPLVVTPHSTLCLALDVSYKWRHLLYCLLCLGSFTHNVPRPINVVAHSSVASDFGMEFTIITRVGATVPTLEMGGLGDKLVRSRPP